MDRKTDLTSFLQCPDAAEAGGPSALPQLPLLLPPGVVTSRSRHAAAAPVHVADAVLAIKRIEGAEGPAPRAVASGATARSSESPLPVEPGAPAATTEVDGCAPIGCAAPAGDAPGGMGAPEIDSAPPAEPDSRPPQRLALVKGARREPVDEARRAELEDRRQSRLRSLAQEAVEIAERDAWDAQRVGYISSTMVQLTLPHREPDRNLATWGRRHESGKSLVIQPGFYLSDETDAKGNRVPVGLGYPYGSIPRLILAWVGREVVRTRDRELNPSESLAGFMRDLGITTSNGGERGTITRVRDQVRRLFSARIALVDKPSSANWSNHGFQIADSIETWWSSGADVSQRALFRSRIVLSQVFYDEILRSPVPLDMRALAALKQSPMALDVYCWLTYRYFLASASGAPISIRWEVLSRQFGSESEIGRFRQLFRQALHKVRAVYPQARFDADGPTHLTLLPSPPHVRPRPVAFSGKGGASVA